MISSSDRDRSRETRADQPTGLTKDVGWQIGVSMTVDHPVEAVWDLLTSPEGIAIWLGDGVAFEGMVGESYETAHGVRGELRSYRPRDRIRLTWRPATWDHDTTAQVAVQAKGARTLVRFHQERLADNQERERQRAHWKRVAAEVERALDRRARPWSTPAG